MNDHAHRFRTAQRKLLHIVRLEIARCVYGKSPLAACAVLGTPAKPTRRSAVPLYVALERLAARFPPRQQAGDALDEIRQYIGQTACLLARDNLSPKVLAAVVFLDRHYRDQINRNSVAEYVGCSPLTVYHGLYRELGLTLCPYVRRLRISEALTLLPDAQNTILVARRVGYRSYDTFLEAFRKEITVCTPSEYHALF